MLFQSLLDACLRLGTQPHYNYSGNLKFQRKLSPKQNWLSEAVAFTKPKVGSKAVRQLGSDANLLSLSGHSITIEFPVVGGPGEFPHQMSL